MKQGVEFSANEYFMDASFVLPITVLCMHCMHKLFVSVESIFSRFSVVIAFSLGLAGRLACHLSCERTQVSSILFYASFSSSNGNFYLYGCCTLWETLRRYCQHNEGFWLMGFGIGLWKILSSSIESNCGVYI
ncbi:uncharacterized protein LOC131045577 isoform X2 [Cryptomeria japonica]|uniref:uncharacterized protein LOC131045577 isoform X2 n=1 Tax=Cryptomeria japonica TaxID=3369 RepID=UPI0025AC5F37|nr:uncharacterized protein LOC131045577 isoform X2 [Cryptomeria japonica]